MNSESVHLIATDPPFNKNKDFHATPDSLAAGAQFQDRWSWRDDTHDDWLIEIQRDHPEVWTVITTAKTVYGDGMAAFLCWMGVRLLECHRVLKDTGSLYLHCDPTASHYLKLLMNAIFGKVNFRNEIVWHYGQRTSFLGKHLSRKHDCILFYAASPTSTVHRVSEPWTKKEFLQHRHDVKKDASGSLQILSDGGNPGTRYGRAANDVLKAGKPLDDVWNIPNS